MLTELRIHDFAIINRLELHFKSGLVTFTGETGAGKSIIIDAVEALMGGRVETTMIRAGADRAVLEADFKIPPPVRPQVHELLAREDMLDDPDFVTLGREIRAEGRHIARINGRSVTVALLKELGEHLVDVHGQSEHLSLLRVREHLRLLDSFAGVGALAQNYHDTYTRLRSTQSALAELRSAERDAARRADLLRYQIDEIEAAGLKLGEDETLKQERNRLANAESLATHGQQALFSLDESGPESQPATDLIGAAVEALSHIARLDSSQQPLVERAQELFDGLADLTLELRDYIETIEFNPQRLQDLEERLDLIQGLKRKYGSSIAEVLAFAEKAGQELEAIGNAEERIASLEKEEIELLKQIAGQGEALFKARQAAAKDMSAALEDQLKDLRMVGALFDVEFTRKPDPLGVPLEDGQRVAFGPHGLESVQFLVAPNPGEGLKPLAKIASGGEMSRLMLALKNVLAQADLTPTLIFDEIDQGIGGRVGAVVGEKLWQLSRQHQVLCITHLPQLAAFGSQHFRVTKHVEAGRTTTQVQVLGQEERVAELAQMLGGASEATMQSARDMLAGVADAAAQR